MLCKRGKRTEYSECSRVNDQLKKANQNDQYNQNFFLPLFHINTGWRVAKLTLSFFMRITQWHFGGAHILLWEHFQLCFSPLFKLFFCSLCFSTFLWWILQGFNEAWSSFLWREKRVGIVSINSNKPFQMIDINVFDFSHASAKGLSCPSPLSTSGFHSPSILGKGKVHPSVLAELTAINPNELELYSSEARWQKRLSSLIQLYDITPLRVHDKSSLRNISVHCRRFAHAVKSVNSVLFLLQPSAVLLKTCSRCLLWGLSILTYGLLMPQQAAELLRQQRPG